VLFDAVHKVNIRSRSQKYTAADIALGGDPGSRRSSDFQVAIKAKECR